MAQRLGREGAPRAKMFTFSSYEGTDKMTETIDEFLRSTVEYQWGESGDSVAQYGKKLLHTDLALNKKANEIIVMVYYTEGMVS